MEKGSNRSKRIRTRSVHFQDIEGDSEARLTGYEKDVLNVIRSTKDSPDEKMIEAEAAIEKQKQTIQTLRRLMRYAKYARLTRCKKSCHSFKLVGNSLSLIFRRWSWRASKK